jgi:TonB family protein
MRAHLSLLPFLGLALAWPAAGQAPSTGAAGAQPSDAARHDRNGAAEEPVLAVPPKLLALVPADVPPGTVFPAPEVPVVLSIDVSATGAVEAVRVDQGAGEPFDSAAVAAAQRFEFEPARLSTGEAVPVTIAFRLTITAPPPAPPPPPPAAAAAPVVLSGRLLERGTRRPLANVPVAARGPEGVVARATTGADGRFRLQVPLATFTVVAVPSGHERLAAPVEARPGEEREESFYLEASGGANETVVRERAVQREVTKQVIPAEDVAKVAGTQGDTLGAVLNMPGVARSSFGGVSLVLRGSAPRDSRVFLDGQEIPILYHFGGLRSTVNPRFLEAVEFVPGNFSVEYGRAIGGIVDVKLRDPADDLFRGDVGVNFYDGGFSLEGPLGGGWAGGAAFHRSWIDTLLPLFVPSDSNVSFDTAPRYYDYQFLATRKLWGGSLRTIWYGSMDKIVVLFDRPAEDPKISGQVAARTLFHGLQVELDTPVASRLRQRSSLQVSLQQFRTRFGPQFFFDLDAVQLGGRSAWTWAARDGLSLTAGLDLLLTPAKVAVNAPLVPKEGEPQPPISTQPTVEASIRQTTWHPAMYLEATWEPARGVTVTPGVRLDRYSELSRWTLDPRLAARWEVARGTALKAGAGVFQQPPSADESAKGTGTPDLQAERALHVSAGVEQRLGEGLQAEVTGFHKKLDRLVVRNPAFAFDSAARQYVNEGTGRIYGLEVLVRARAGDRASGWLAYTFQRSFRTDGFGRPERPFTFDQPHILTAVANYTFSPRWSAGTRLRFVSGNPETPVVAPYSVLDAASGVYVPISGEPNSTRASPFAQLDARVDRTWIHRTWKLSAFLDVQNVTNRGNEEGTQYSYDYSRREKLTGLPILPILGVEGQW